MPKSFKFKRTMYVVKKIVFPTLTFSYCEITYQNENSGIPDCIIALPKNSLCNHLDESIIT